MTCLPKCNKRFRETYHSCYRPSKTTIPRNICLSPNANTPIADSLELAIWTLVS